MIHGTTDHRTTWCGEPADCVTGWVCNAPDEVECIACLRSELGRIYERAFQDGRDSTLKVPHALTGGLG